MIRVSFALQVPISASPQRVWDELVNWEGHSDWVPATRVIVLENSQGVGTRFVARTGLGPAGFDDNMTVTEYGQVELSCAVNKTGPLLRGTATFRVDPSGHGSVVRWTEDVLVPGPAVLTPIVAPVLAAAGKAGFRHALRSLARQVLPEP